MTHRNVLSKVLISTYFLSPTFLYSAEVMQPEVINTLWVVITAAMVFLMQAGFALLETGMVRAKTPSM